MASKGRSRDARSRRGFAAMDPDARREISKRGGEASHESGRGHEFNSEEAREAGRRGGEARWGSREGREEISEEELTHSSYRVGSEEASLEDARARRGGEGRWSREEQGDDEVSGPRSSRIRYEEEEEEDVRRDVSPREYGGEARAVDDRGRRGRLESATDSEDRRDLERERSGGRSRQGFASMDPEQQREIARSGGEASGRARRGRAR